MVQVLFWWKPQIWIHFKARNVAAMKSSVPLSLVSDCIAASLAEAVIHKQPRLIKRLSLNVPPQWVVDFQQRGQIATELIVHNGLYFHFTSLLSVCFSSLCFVVLSIYIPAGLLGGFVPSKPLKVSLRLSPLKSTKGPSAVFIDDQRAQTADSRAVIQSKQGARERDRILADYKIAGGADLSFMKVFRHFSSSPIDKDAIGISQYKCPI